MRGQFLAGFTCSAALLLGACSGGSVSAPDGEGQSGTITDAGADGTEGGDGTDDGEGTDDGDSAGEAELSALQEANDAYQAALDAVAAAQTAAASSGTRERRAAARNDIEDALKSLDTAVTSASTALTIAIAGGINEAIGAATKVKIRAEEYKTAQARILEELQTTVAWYSKQLVRVTLANGEAVMPVEGSNVIQVERRPRKKPDGTTNSGIGLIGAYTFRALSHFSGKTVFSNSGDEFKADGYVGYLGANSPYNGRGLTGLKITDAGIEIRTGNFSEDYQDALMDITETRGSSNQWDLTIKFDEPLITSVDDSDTSWTGNGDFYWKGIVPIDDSQKEGGTNYDAEAFKQPLRYRDLGTYEVWLSNHFGADKGLEPVQGSGQAPYPDDDVPLYLKYAAYGMFVYTADTDTYKEGVGLDKVGHIGRVNSMYFGYQAFRGFTGSKTTDINKAITNGKFVGQTFATAIKGNHSGGQYPIETRLLRGDVALTVNIPKTTGTGTLSGSINNFEQWNGTLWHEFSDNLSVVLRAADTPSASTDPAAIGADGSFNGWVTIKIDGAIVPATGSPSSASGEQFNGGGDFKGNIYGPRTDTDLEIAGSWKTGSRDGNGRSSDKWSMIGSFGAKQLPAEDTSSN